MILKTRVWKEAEQTAKKKKKEEESRRELGVLIYAFRPQLA